MSHATFPNALYTLQGGAAYEKYSREYIANGLADLPQRVQEVFAPVIARSRATHFALSRITEARSYHSLGERWLSRRYEMAPSQDAGGRFIVLNRDSDEYRMVEEPPQMVERIPIEASRVPAAPHTAPRGCCAQISAFLTALIRKIITAIQACFSSVFRTTH